MSIRQASNLDDRMTFDDDTLHISSLISFSLSKKKHATAYQSNQPSCSCTQVTIEIIDSVNFSILVTLVEDNTKRAILIDGLISLLKTDIDLPNFLINFLSNI